MNPADAVPEPAAPGAALSDHLPCASCAYDLHGLRPCGLCPECGWPIEKTLEAGGLDYRWLVEIHSGVQALLVAHYVLLGSVALCFLLPVGLCIHGILLLGGAVELGTPHPEAPPSDTRSRRPAQILGGGMMTGILGAILLLGAPFLGAAIIVLGVGAMGVGNAMLWRHFAGLMLQRFSPAAGHSGRALAWAHGLIVATLALAAGLALWPDPNFAGSGAAPALAMFAVLLWGICAIAALITLHTASKALRQAMGDSRPLEPAAEPRVVEEKPRPIR